MAAKTTQRRTNKRPQKKSSSKAPQTVPETVSSSVLSGILGVSDRWLRELAAEGYAVKTGRAEYHLAKSVQGAIRRVRETEVEKRVEEVSSRQLFEAERARKLKLENDKREARLIDTDDALAAIDHIFGEVRTALAGIAANATDDVVLRRRIDDAIDNALNGIADRHEEAGAALQEGRDPLATESALNG